MGRVRTTDKYIGSGLRNDIEVGDEVCVKFENGTYMNREVTDVHQMSSTKGEVTIGDSEHTHAVLGWRIDEGADALGHSEDWSVHGYELLEEPGETHDFGGIEALYIVGEGLRAPDMTFEEAEEEGAADLFREPQEMHDHLHNILEATNTLLGHVEDLERGAITMAEFEQALDTLQTKHGGRFPFDGPG